ncbi:MULTISPECIES: dioxygenase [unclassified Bradyrhizobium]|uniref:dioxygenase family protein n=1 Tax=unclassified Bradyrhizobium TaxID=2631580 RepID=UPI002478DFB2|nr:MULTISPECIES: dioxygenase [unclassified Bradyrhizobium]WGS19868.1 hydroxyquinol 1,2-dioxygenase [Bradyrhizobium sp. ISRA463]WGS26719.1 hydroxyquinol 1,2-dioxygenase [Bradyrhizobium sp. ISRA464]
MPYVTETTITDIVLERWKAVPDRRLRQIMQSMITHLHAFVREIEPTEEEWMAAIEWLTRTGKQSNDKRQEFILASDVVGVSMLVDCINNRLSGEATPTTVKGPFHVHDSPNLADGADIANGAPGEPCYIVGSVHGVCGAPIAGATLDIWQADGEGLYDAQRGSDEPWMRGIFKSSNDGRFVVQTVLPVPYSIPMDGSVGEVMSRTEISPMRPSHIHFLIEAKGHHRLVTHLFKKSCPYIETDAVYGVKAPLIVEFRLMPAGSTTPTGKTANQPFWLLEYDFVLQPAEIASAAAPASVAA